MQRTIKKLEASPVSNDDYNKGKSSEYDDSSADDVAGPNRNHPALTRQADGKGKSKHEGKNKNDPVGRLGRS